MKSYLAGAVLVLALTGMGSGASAAPEPLRLSLADAIARALSEGTAARLATVRTDEASALALEARSALRPQISLGGLVASQSINLQTYGFSPPAGEPPVVGPFDVYDTHLTIAMNVIDFAAKRRYAAAQAGIKVSEEERRRTENDVAAAVASLYVSVGRASSRIEGIRADVELFGKLRQLALDQKNAGVGTRLDTTRSDVQLARRQQALLAAINQRDAARLALLRAIGADLGSEVELADDWSRAGETAPVLADALATAQGGRPELTVLTERERAADLSLAAARAEKLPTVGIQAQGVESGNHPDELLWSRTIGASVNVPLWTGRRTEARIAQAQARLAQLKLEHTDTLREIEQQVRQALLTWDNAASRVELAEQGVRLADDELEQASDRFKNGVAPSIEVDNAQTSLVAARDARIDALADLAQARFDLARATGQIRSLIPQPQNSADSRSDGGTSR
jgi:outer membrane protein